MSKRLIYIMVCLIAFNQAPAQNATSITAGGLKRHVGYLASQGLGGRCPGTAGDLAAATYIRDCFLQYRLTPMAKNGFQPFEVTLGVKEGPANKFFINGQTATPEKDFIPLTISDNGSATGSVVFVGYGFKINSDSLKWDDYAGMDLHGKIALILMGAPDPSNNTSIDPFEESSFTRAKLINARDAGAAAVILVAGAEFDARDELGFGSLKESTAGLPAIRVKRAFLNLVLAGANIKIEEVEKQLNQSLRPMSKDLGIQASVTADIITQLATTQNVIGYIQAPDTGAMQKWVVIGAHFDHLGMGGQGSSSRIQDTIGVHPGADDNASGVATMIEMAGYLSSVREKLKQSVLFVAFTGEEMGLLGSKYFVENCPVPVKQISAMINLDMVGRPNEEKRLSISGTGTALQMDSLLALTEPGNLKWAKSPEGFGPSDHASFYTAGIPVLYFTTGAHLDYHTPADTPDKLDYINMSEIGAEVSGIVLSIAGMPEPLTFKTAGAKVAQGGMKKLRVTLGIMPDVSGTENNGLRVEFATPGKPAQVAGITKGDRIISINNMQVTNIHDYMTRLQSLKPGQTVSVELLRGDKKMVVLVQL